jgi:hypothetical protein
MNILKHCKSRSDLHKTPNKNTLTFGGSKPDLNRFAKNFLNFGLSKILREMCLVISIIHSGGKSVKKLRISPSSDDLMLGTANNDNLG